MERNIKYTHRSPRSVRHAERTSSSSVKEETQTEELEPEIETPKYDPNVDRFKDVPAYVVGSEDNNDSN